MTKIKCENCETLLFKATGEINVEIKCRKCKHINKIKARFRPLKLVYSKYAVK